ncbi:XRE family transcriptional regulator [Nonomuraea sp. NPDC023979]|uniref:XRE family transcriptional regulator n=1 Tax=Nonomuraea sp. NPDC023979 TaxID=3154796 RepID=UPI0033D041A8
MNNNLRYAMTAARLNTTDIAAALAVDPKTVSRWLQGRIPYPRHRWAVADLLHVDEAELWPEVGLRQRVLADGIEAIYPHRWAVPHTIWRNLFAQARQEIGILAYSALFLAEDQGTLDILADRAKTGVRVRILLGDPEGKEVAARGADEGIGADVMVARAKNALTLYRPLLDIDGVDIRLHRTVLYNSIYRADQQMLVNTHAYGTPAANAPVMHLNYIDDQGPAATYIASMAQVWTDAQPCLA